MALFKQSEVHEDKFLLMPVITEPSPDFKPTEVLRQELEPEHHRLPCPSTVPDLTDVLMDKLSEFAMTMFQNLVEIHPRTAN